MDSNVTLRASPSIVHSSCVLCAAAETYAARAWVLIIRAGVDASTVTSQQAERISELFHTYAHDG